MSLVMKRFTKGVVLKGITDETTIASLDGEGSIFQNSSDLRLKAYIEGSVRQIVTNSQSQVLTNKTIDADNNTVSNIETDNLKAGVLNTSTTLTSASNTQIPSALAVKTYVDNSVASKDQASEISYSNATSGLTATNVQDAVDEIDNNVDNLVSLSGVALDSTTLGTFTGTTIPDSQTVKQALQALETAHEEVDQNANDLISLSGVAENSANLGVFTGTTIPDNQTIKQALQALETSQEEIDQNANDLITLSGVAENATSLGSFTGTTIPDNQTIKQALQALETEVEGKLDIGNINATSIADGSVDNTEFQYLNGVTSAIQTQLDAKTDESGGSLTNGSIVTPSRLDVKQDTFANLQTYATTASNGQLVFATDLKQTYQIIDGALKVVGGAGGINYISNPDFESGTTGYATYADVAGEAPVDGTGGTATFVSIGTDSVSPLRGTKSGLISKTANNAQGQGVSYAFTIDAADQAQILRISFDSSTSVNYVDGDIRVYIYDVTNSRLIEVVDRDLYASSQGKFVGTFQTSPDSLSYRLIFHIAGTGTTAWTVELDNVIVGPQTIVKGAIQTDTQTIPAANYGALAGLVAVAREETWSREGEFLNWSGYINTTITGATLGEISVVLPFGLSIDLTKKSVSGNNELGICQLLDSSTTGDNGIVIPSAVVLNGIRFIFENGQTANSSTNLPTGMTYDTSDFLRWNVRIPILGWSSNVVLSEDAGNREIAARYERSAAQSIPTAATTPMQFDSKIFDTTNSFSGDAYTIPESGIYQAHFNSSMNASFNAGNIHSIGIEKNGTGLTVSTDEFATTTTVFSRLSCSCIFQAQKGDLIKFTIFQNTGGSLNTEAVTGFNSMSIAKLSSPQTIAASEVVAAKYYGSTTTVTSSSLNPQKFNTPVFDTHNAYNTTTGYYTVPQSGVYRISANIGFNATTSATGRRNLLNVIQSIDGVTFSNTGIIGSYAFQVIGTFDGSVNGSTLLNLAKGSIVYISAAHGSNITDFAPLNTTETSFSIEKVG